MAALLRRAWDLDVISDGRYRQLNIELSRAGYRSIEPVVLVDEVPALWGIWSASGWSLGKARWTSLATRS